MQVSSRERRAQILKLLDSNDEIFVTELAAQMDTSEVTIRKDLTQLQNRNLLIRTRGGAIRLPKDNNNEDTAISKKRLFNAYEKERIGAKAASLIQEGDHIMLDSGTTTLEIAKNLDNFNNLTILTNSLNIAIELMKYQRFTVIVLGGHVRFTSHSTVGPLAVNTLRNFNNFKLFLGVDSFSLETGISTPSLEEALLNQQMMASASETIAVCDSSKFNKQSFAHIADPEQLNLIITDTAIPETIHAALQRRGIKVMLA